MLDVQKPRYVNQTAGRQPLQNPISDLTLDRVRRYRLQRIRDGLINNDCAGILLSDPINIRYATDTTNMQVWILHNAARYALVMTEGPVVVFEFHSAGHLAEASPIVDEVRKAISWFYFSAGEGADKKVVQWADEIDDIFKAHGGGNKRLAVDKCDPAGTHQLENRGIEIVEGQRICELARVIKSADELELADWTIEVCQSGMQRMYDLCVPGQTEQQVWAELHHENIVNGGDWIETRLLASGPRTNPWFHECNDRIIEEGDILSFDTDLIGPYGYCADISRAWTVGHTRPTNEQATLHAHAMEQIEHNTALLKPGLTFDEFNNNAWVIPDKYIANRYSCALHGVGLCDEYPIVACQPDFDPFYGPAFEENMTVCVESFIGEEGGREGVKLETQVLITQDGPKVLDDFPFGLVI